MNNSWVYKRSGKILVHTLAWLIVFSLPYLLRYNNDDFIRRNPDSRSFMYVSLLTGFFWIMTFYLNARILIPRFLYTKKYFLYVLLLSPVFIIILLFHWQVFELLITSRGYSLPVATAYNLPAFVLTIAASTAYKVLDIIYMEGLKDYLKIHLKNNKPVITRMTFKEMEEQLPSTRFIRIHKSYIVSVACVTSVRKNSILVQDAELPVGETYKENVARLVGRAL